MSAAGSVAIRVDASAEIGLGHLSRCRTLAEQLRQDGFTVRFLSSQGNEGCTDELRDADASLEIVGRHPAGVSWIIVDHYGLAAPWERTIRAAGHRVLAIDDFRHRSHCADMLVSDGNRPFDPALNSCPPPTTELAGADYAIVDPSFAPCTAPRHSADPWRTVISYGGSDPTGETIKNLKAIQLLRRREELASRMGRVDVVVGPVNEAGDDIARLAAEIPDVWVHLAPDSLAPVLRQADLFLTAGGHSMIEALTMRRLCLVTQTADNQSLGIAGLREQGAILSLGHHRQVEIAQVADAVADALTHLGRYTRELLLRSPFDHLGARRISTVLQNSSLDLG